MTDFPNWTAIDVSRGSTCPMTRARNRADNRTLGGMDVHEPDFRAARGVAGLRMTALLKVRPRRIAVSSERPKQWPGRAREFADAARAGAVLLRRIRRYLLGDDRVLFGFPRTASPVNRAMFQRCLDDTVPEGDFEDGAMIATPSCRSLSADGCLLGSCRAAARRIAERD
ncbi:hypothetical protein [Methylobacterium phyllostachyos]|uniref:hypothetical protein n=1 Tax=Methylobacterium phyllostachyos TaxID=582672 RepID=UPI001160068E|nr:hypothetical protein [Methylobacterium phyllostachyos]